MYQFSEDDLNSRLFFKFSKKWVLNMNWALLPIASKIVLPVIYAFDNGKGQSWPSEATIGALSGLSRKTVRKGVDGLLSMTGLSFDWQMTAHGRKSKRFKFQRPGDGDPVFFFHKIILTGGNWRMLKGVSKAVYPVLRTFSAWDKQEAEEEDGGILDDAGNDYREAYANREFDYSEMVPPDIARFAGIAKSKVYEALEDLEKYFLIEKDAGRWKVFLTPPKYFKRGFLNESLMKSFAHELKRGEDGFPF